MTSTPDATAPDAVGIILDALVPLLADARYVPDYPPHIRDFHRDGDWTDFTDRAAKVDRMFIEHALNQAAPALAADFTAPLAALAARWSNIAEALTVQAEHAILTGTSETRDAAEAGVGAASYEFFATELSSALAALDAVRPRKA